MSDSAAVAFPDPSTKYPFKLVRRLDTTHNVIWLRFELKPDQILGIKPGQHLMTHGKVEDDVIARPYSPISLEHDKGFFEIALKVYKPNEQYPKGGKLSQFMETLKVGDMVEFKGPVGKYRYMGNGVIHYTGDNKEKTYKHIGMIAGGSGVTPLLSVAKAICNDPEDQTKVSMIFSNYTEADILLREQLEELVKKHGDKFKVWYTLTRGTSQGWKYGEGRINEEMVKKHLPAPGPDTIVLICGPKGMYETGREVLEKVGHAKDAVFP